MGSFIFVANPYLVIRPFVVVMLRRVHAVLPRSSCFVLFAPRGCQEGYSAAQHSYSPHPHKLVSCVYELSLRALHALVMSDLSIHLFFVCVTL